MYTQKVYKSKPLTLAEAIEYYSYTLQVGASWAHERGNKKVNTAPATIAGLMTALNNAANNAARDGNGGSYSYKLAVDTVAV
jgi:hypothetical protein